MKQNIGVEQDQVQSSAHLCETPQQVFFKEFALFQKKLNFPKYTFQNSYGWMLLVNINSNNKQPLILMYRKLFFIIYKDTSIFFFKIL